MIGQLNHIAIAVPDLEAATAKYRDALVRTGFRTPQRSGRARSRRDGRHFRRTAQHQNRAPLSAPRRQLADPALRFLDKPIPRGACIHVCFEVDSSTSWRRATSLKSEGARVLGDGEPKIGAHGKPVLFLHPKDFCGTLVEIEQA